MKPLNIVSATLRTKLIIATILILAFVVLSAVGFFYYYTDRELGESYAQKIFTLPQFKAIIVRNSLYIYTLFALVASVGIAAIVILYTHRIVGPLKRMERLMGQMSEGNFEEVVRFRKGDAVHLLADALQDVAIRYKERRGIIRDSIHEMHRDSVELQELVKRGDIKAAEDKRQNIEKKAGDISKLLSGIKL